MSDETNETLSSFFRYFNEDLTDCIRYDQKINFAIERQRDRMYKRADYGDASLGEKAISNFKQINEIAKSIVVSLDQDIANNSKLFIRKALESFTKANVDAIQCTLDLPLMFNLWRFGPGASNGIKGTHFSLKIKQKMTCTIGAKPYVRMLRQLNPHLNGYDCRNNNDEGITLIYGSRLTTVPKNQETARTIAIEPSGNMAMQLAAGAYLEGALRSVGLDIRDQQFKNKKLARIGSIDGSIATIDLSNASDLITPNLVQTLLPQEWFHFLMSIRSSEMELPGGERIQLGMMSTMGNGFTFPLMTLILLSLIYGIRAKNNSGPKHWVDYSNTCVFGDDIIIPTHEFVELCTTLSSCGLVVNQTKSYNDGYFRESCGGDYYEGYNVTPVYVKSLSTNPEIYVGINQLLEWSARHRIGVSKSLSYLVSKLHGQPFLVPEWMDPTCGIRTSLVKRRYKALMPKQFFVKCENHPLNMLCALGGYVRSLGDSVAFLPRENAGKYHVVELRLPRGFLDGRSPCDRGDEEAAWVARLVWAVLG